MDTAGAVNAETNVATSAATDHTGDYVRPRRRIRGVFGGTLRSEGEIRMYYVVGGMQLIPQTKTMACWYASAQMLIQWRRQTRQQSESGIYDPSEDADLVKIKDKDSGIGNKDILGMALKLGLQSVPPMTPTEETLEAWLKRYGPLWVNGKTHIVVIAGIKPGNLLVFDPAPVNSGTIGWRTIRGWYIGSGVDSRDTSRAVEAVFLHCPC